MEAVGLFELSQELHASQRGRLLPHLILDALHLVQHASHLLVDLAVLIINHARHDETAYRKGAGAGEEQAPKGGKYRFDIDEINAFIDEHVEAIY